MASPDRTHRTKREKDVRRQRTMEDRNLDEAADEAEARPFDGKAEDEEDEAADVPAEEAGG